MQVIGHFIFLIVTIDDGNEFIAERNFARTVFLLLQRDRVVTELSTQIAFDAEEF